ncbi:uncharacterized protein K460DRAFT_412456 [Cucurbitaria berberidis CBS 394.84]|uniref:RING-type domain-containing protein n=1 Tax=Cucurbitaria berberidis CBS 394.84 TaxID=1168544 RepID=A0A9P4GT47_9PLEO|nr:uncharacterized protein K460DRAFT_412456 [Cucurbitaria berberidis CBS 394.84]KAF1850809.1 hypothetical protein K460DRAFT_412456 [Cucurbitaria berberidis CBS 394.84]
MVLGGKLCAIFWSAASYDHKTETNISAEDGCFICKERFATNTNEEGCHAIRLTHCNHVVGHECFRQWSARVPETCPYWNHHLPSIPRSRQPDENWGVTILRWICSTRWFSQLDYLISESDIAFLQAHDVTAFIDLQMNRMTIAGFKTIWQYYSSEAIAISFVLGCLLSLCIAGKYRSGYCCVGFLDSFGSF